MIQIFQSSNKLRVTNNGKQITKGREVVTSVVFEKGKAKIFIRVPGEPLLKDAPTPASKILTF